MNIRELRGIQAIKTVAACMLFSALWITSVFASPEPNNEEQPPYSEVIMHHVQDQHHWHLATLPGGGHIEIHLPWLIYNSERGIDFFWSEEAAKEKGYIIDSHDKAIYVGEGGAPTGVHADPGHEEAHPEHKEGVTVIDFSMTKTVVQMLLISLLMVVIFTAVARGYKKREGQAPKGIQSFFEPVVIFVREQIAQPYLQHKADRLLPYLLSLFFFIWFSNMLGLTPFNSNIAGNISVTFALALLTLILTWAHSTKDYWKHVFWFPGVPVPLKIFIMLPIELIGMFTKPFALMMRLFANISAGHFMVLSLIGLIFIMGENGQNIGGAAAGGFLAFVFSLFIFCLELLVAAVQAYVFTLLTAVFIGQAMETHDEHH